MALNKTMTFDLELKPGGIPPIVHASQGDIGRMFKANIYWDGSAATAYLTGATVNLRGRKPDKTVFDYSATLAGSTVTFETTEQMTIISGPVECELVFSQGGDVIASANFVLIVEESPYDPNALSESDVEGLTDVLAGFQRLNRDSNGVVKIGDGVTASGTAEPITGFYVHDEETDTDGVAKVSIEAVQEFEDDIRDETSKWLDGHPEASTTVLPDSLTTDKYKDESVTLAKIKKGDLGYVAPDMYGAACDGTTNDAVALGQCFTDAAANGLIVYIPKDMVVGWNAPVFMPSNLHFVIDGELRAVGTNAQLETYDRVTETPGYTASHDVVVEGAGAVNMRGHILTTGGPSPFRIHHAKNIIIRDISIFDCSMYHAIECGGTDGLTVDNVKFKGMHANGVDGWHEYVQLEDITSDGTGGAIPYDGTVTKNVIIRNCYFGPGDNGGACYTAVGTHSDPDDYFTNFLIENCEIVNSMEFPLRFAEKIKGMTIRDCSITRGGGTYGRGSLYLGDDLHNIVVSECDFGDTPGRHISLVHQAAPNGEGLTNVTIKNNVFREYGTSGQDPLGLHLAAITTNLCIKDNVFLNKLSTSNRPIHIPGTTLNGYSEGLNITGNVFYSKSLEWDNYSRWSERMGRHVLYEPSGGVQATGYYTLNDEWSKYDEIIIVWSKLGVSQTSSVIRPKMASSVEITNSWITTSTTSPFVFQQQRLLVTLASTNQIQIGRNQAVINEITTDANDIITAQKCQVLNYSAELTASYFLRIDKVIGVQRTNDIVYV